MKYSGSISYRRSLLIPIVGSICIAMLTCLSAKADEDRRVSRKRIEIDGRNTLVSVPQGKTVTEKGLKVIKDADWLRLLSPNGGEYWDGGSIHEIIWHCDYPDSLHHYRLLHSTDDGNSYLDTITDNIPNTDTSYTWLVPAVNFSICRVKVQALTASDSLLAEDASDGDFTIETYPTITFPDGGEQLPGGSTQQVTWSTVGQGFGSYRLMYSTDGGSSYPDTIAGHVSPDSTSYTWTLPLINAPTCRVKIQILDSLDNLISEDESDSDFAIETYPTIIFPDGGEQLPGGSTQQITWTTVGQGFSSYRLMYSTDGGSSYPDTIASNVSPDSISWNWTLPLINAPACRVKIQILDSLDNLISEDTSNSNFTIKVASTVTSPNGGEVWGGNTTHPITWSTIGTGFASYRILYSTDSGSSYPNTIAINVSPDSTSYNWALPPLVDCNSCRVKMQILDAGDSVLSEDASNGDFTIKIAPTVRSPNGREVWYGDTPHLITWSTIGRGFGSFNIFYSLDSGINYYTIATNVSQDSTSWTWRLPPDSCTTCRVKVQMLDSLNGFMSEDESNNDFTIIPSPNIWVKPPSFDKSLSINKIGFNTLWIGNTGNKNLDFKITGPRSTYAVRRISKIVSRRPVLSGIGGPDSAGYKWIDCDKPEGSTYNWIEITGIGTPITGLGDDNNVGPYPIGFSFPFYDTSFTQFRFCTNGFISFTSLKNDRSNEAIPHTKAPHNLIAPFWDDLDFSSGGSAYYYSDGSQLVIEYHNVPHYSSGGPYTFEIILKPDGSITFQYQSMSSPINSGTIGIQNSDGTIGLQIACNASYVHDNLSVQILRGWLSVSSNYGMVAPDDSIGITVSFNSLQLDGGDYSTRLYINSNDRITPDIVIPVHLLVPFYIKGYVRDSIGTGISGVRMDLSGDVSKTAITTDSGDYELTDVHSGNYTVTPYKKGYSFSPPNRKYESLNANRIDQNFVGTRLIVSLGEIKVRGGKKGYIKPDDNEVAKIYLGARATGKVTITIYNLRGQLVWDTEVNVSAGKQKEVFWKCVNNEMETVASGIYLIRIKGAGFDEKKKVAVVR